MRTICIAHNCGGRPQILGLALAALLAAVLALAGMRSARADVPGAAPERSAFAPLARTASATGGIGAALQAARAQASVGDFLAPDQAFRFDAVADGADHVRLLWQIADGYYLYRGRIKVSSDDPAMHLGTLVLPTGETKIDEYFGRQEIYHHQLVATVPVAHPAGSSALALKVTYQGCATAGLCYPPITKSIHLVLGGGTAGTVGGSSSAGSSASALARRSGYVSVQDRFAALIQSGSLLVMIGAFFLAGLGLAFTPCVLPMVPILSGIIAGQGEGVTTRRAFLLSLTYVLGMSLTYTLAGALFAAAGKQVQSVFQQPWILVLFAAVFVALALSMFGAFTLQMPAEIQTRVAGLSGRQSAGTYGGVAVMGILSALIVTTCVGPALVGALVVISQTGQVVRGSAALFSMSIGMGTPLLIVGASAGKLLPKAGPWMDAVKKLFGVLMLAVAAWMLARIVPDAVALLVWAVPAFACAWVLWRALVPTSPTGWLVRLAGIGAALYATALVAGAFLGGTDPFSPIPQLASRRAELAFTHVKSLTDLQHQVTQASMQGRPVLLDFYADWCVSCKEMERYTFSDTSVQSALHGTVLLRADVTANDADDQALLRHFGIFGPPTIAFYGADGAERRNFRVVGYMKAAEFAALLHRALGPPMTASSTSLAGAM